MNLESFPSRKGLVALSILLSSIGLNGQAPQRPSIHDLDPFIVTGSATPKRSGELSRPVSVLSSSELLERQASSFGEALKDIPGVHSSSFGAGASRPVIRGFEGARIRILESGIDNMDVSEASPDHAVAMEPFFAESIEVLRGSGTLLYGNSAIGGVVNVIDRRIVRNQGEPGHSTDMYGSFDSASDGWSGGFLTTYTEASWAMALGGLARNHGNYRIPGNAEVAALREAHLDEDEQDHDVEVRDHLTNSFSETENGSLSVSWFPGERTRLSVALMGQDSWYGVPGHADVEEHEDDDEVPPDEEDHDLEGESEDVAIDLRQRNVRVEIEHAFTRSLVRGIQGHWAYSDYRHFEMEGETIGTRFAREGWEGRMEVTHELGDGLPGVSGIQASVSDLRVEGDEAFTPPSTTDDVAVFLLQEWHLEKWRLDGGIRMDKRRIRAEEAGHYDNTAASLSGGLHFRWSTSLAMALSLNHSSRHPTATELYSNGPHAATRQYEIGDPGLDREVSTGVDGALFLDFENFSIQASLFVSRFRDYIYAAPQGTVGDGFPVYHFASVDALFYGMESEMTWHVWHDGESEFHIRFLHDLIRSDIQDSSQNLPRTPPMRIGTGVEYTTGQLTFRTDLRHAFEQDRTAEEELPTGSFTDWTAGIRCQLNRERVVWTFLVQGANLLDDDIRYHTSSLKDLAPMPGRGLKATVSLAF